MGCNFSDDCSECRVGYGLGCDQWDSVEHDSEIMEVAGRFDDPFSCYDQTSSEHDNADYGYDDDCPVSENEVKVETGKLHCVACGERLRKSWMVCPKCGKPIQKKRCQNCGKKLKQKWSYCPNCGQPITATIERARTIGLRPTPQQTSRPFDIRSFNDLVSPSAPSSVYDDDIPF